MVGRQALVFRQAHRAAIGIGTRLKPEAGVRCAFGVLEFLLAGWSGNVGYWWVPGALAECLASGFVGRWGHGWGLSYSGGAFGGGEP